MLLSRLHYGAFLSYSPHGESALAKTSKEVVHLIKQDSYTAGVGGVRVIPHAVVRLGERLTEELKTLLAPDVVLVPAPRSAPFSPQQRDVLWVPRRICEELVKARFGQRVEPWLVRHTRVQKSAGAAPGQRATLEEHYSSMRVEARIADPPRHIVLVDDVITRGATVLAGASLLEEAFPDATVRAFALVRTITNPEEFEEIVAPVVGHVVRTSWGTQRIP